MSPPRTGPASGCCWPAGTSSSPDDWLTPWTDSRWRAHRRGTAIALIDQIHARSAELPPAVVPRASRTRSTASAGTALRAPCVLPADEITALLADTPPGRLTLDVADPAVRAILTLFAEVKAIEQRG